MEPEIFNVAEPPLHIVEDGVMVNIGELKTVISVTALLVQVPIAAITVYEVVIAGFAVTLLPVDALKLPDGLQI